MSNLEEHLVLSPALPEDAEHIYRFIVELATFENEPDAVEVDIPTLRSQLGSAAPPFECLIARYDGEPAGFALFFHNYSTWRGKRGLYLEDLYVQRSHRGRGIGRALLARLAQIAIERDCARFEWSVLDWNKEAITLYESLGARPRAGWTLYQLTGTHLHALAGSGVTARASRA